MKRMFKCLTNCKTRHITSPCPALGGIKWFCAFSSIAHCVPPNHADSFKLLRALRVGVLWCHGDQFQHVNDVTIWNHCVRLTIFTPHGPEGDVGWAGEGATSPSSRLTSSKFWHFIHKSFPCFMWILLTAILHSSICHYPRISVVIF